MLFPRMTETQGWGKIACTSPALAYIHNRHLPWQQQKCAIIFIDTTSVCLASLALLNLTAPFEIWAPFWVKVPLTSSKLVLGTDLRRKSNARAFGF